MNPEIIVFSFQALHDQHPVLFSSLLFFFGSCWGSFANVCIYRLPRGLTVITRPSHCLSCKSTISLYRNIPLFGYFLNGGRCSKCGWFYSPRYLIIEVLGGIFALACFVKFGFSSSFIAGFLFALTMIVISVIDIDYQIIPDELSIGGAVIAIALSLFNMPVPFLASLGGGLLGAATLYLFALIYRSITGIDGLGGGDIKLLAFIGAFLGWQASLTVIFLGSVLGTCYGLFPIVFAKKGLRSPIPFGPFLCTAALLFLFFDHQFLRYALILVFA